MRPAAAAFAALLLSGAPLVQAPAIKPIASLTSDDFSDLAFLKPLLADARIVQLGEAGHGMGDVSQLKVRLVRFLIREMGFTVVAFESSMYLAHQADARARDISAQSMLTSSLIGVWHTKEVLPLFEQLKASRGTGREIRLAGFDVQPIGSGKKTRPAFFRRLLGDDPAYAAEVDALDTAFLAEYDKGSASRRAHFREHGPALIAAYERLAAAIDSRLANPARLADRHALLAGRQEARSMASYVRMQSATDARAIAERRDEGMAANVTSLANDLFPGQRMVVWGHNYHVAHAVEEIEPRADVFPGVPARAMGGWLRDRFGRGLYTIGIYPFEGRAVDNSRAEYAIAAPASGSLEARLGVAAMPASFLDIAGGTRAGIPWLREAVAARFDGRLAQRLVPADQYDAVIVVRRVSPPVFLY